MDLNLVRKERLKALNFQIYKDIFELLNDIPTTKCDVNFGDIITAKANVNEELQRKVYECAISLKPWRKGPFKLLDTFIDSEWQSFMKFNILKPYLNLKDKKIADIGCNNGYYLFKMSQMNASKLVGFDPSIRTYLQFKFIDKFISSGIKYELLGVEHLPFYEHKFDTILCLGVLYHRSDPLKMLKDLKQGLNQNGEVFLDTMFIDGDKQIALVPKNTYSKIGNIHFVPTIPALENWCERAKFKSFEVLATKETNQDEQRKTSWIDGESLGDFLDPCDQSLTIEGYPAPKRVYVRLKI
ncbi:MAG: tRNA 5-methoxyuridine(34)/uridine 5-oxyacetic acid(34) synthase CmoB [Campylobacter sp.]|nr:tRNA 5-methoxyuridine(34)/uridine 5-oxyacetic acid(34) synthase CmoB [Campylobacter sp.]